MASCTVEIEYLEKYRREWKPLCYAKKGDSGFDLRAVIDGQIMRLWPGETKLISAGIRIAVPEGFEVQIRSRSGLAVKHGIMVLNSPGTIDSSYRGEVKIILHNSCTRGNSGVNLSNVFDIIPGMRIAQAVVAIVPTVTLVTADSLDMNTDRGTGGFGSTGV